MPDHSGQDCAQHQTTQALLRDELAGTPRVDAQRHLEECERCRARFRQQTASRFPRLRNYTFVERIGEGGFGVVYKVVHHAKERTEALKILFGKTPVRARYFQNEVHLIARLRHPNIATLYEAHLGSPPLYYTMEFVEGQQLDPYLRSRQVPLAQRIELVKSVAAAVGYAHERGVIHRDLKPQNILIDHTGQPHIVDFGIAKRIGLAGREGTAAPRSPEGVLGTFGYIAPEQLAGEEVDARADIYALGALLYHCATGEPAKFATRADRLSRVLRERQVTRAEDLAAIIARCVHPLPEGRYPSCAVLIEDLDRYLAGRSIRARPDSTLGYRLLRSAAYVVRHRPLTVRLLLVAVVAAALTALSWRVGARWASPGADVIATTMLVLGESTRQAMADGAIGGNLPGLDADNVKSWRLLRGQLMERLAEAGPSVVVWDNYFPDCQPQYDDALIRGFETLRAVHVPVVIGTRHLDINSRPHVCPRILAAAHSFGTLASTDPVTLRGEWVVPICVQRGFAPPVPGLAVAAFAAARYPDANLDLQIESDAVVLRYRKRQAPVEESAWHAATDEIRCTRSDRVTQKTGDGMLLAEDTVYQMRIPAVQDTMTAVPQVAWEEALRADREQLRRWFRGRAVLIGEMLPGVDQYLTATGDSVFGCAIQSQAIQALLTGAHVQPITRFTLVATILIWCLLAALLVNLAPPARMLGLGVVVGGGLVLTLAGAAIVLTAASWSTGFWQIQTRLAIGALLATGSLIYMVNTVRERQLRLAPELDWAGSEQSVPTTLLATTSDSPTGEGWSRAGVPEQPPRAGDPA